MGQMCFLKKGKEYSEGEGINSWNYVIGCEYEISFLFSY